jgi:hypothetical protein
MGHVYILRSGNEHLFKIGRTSGDVDLRVRQLSTGNPHPLTIFDVIKTLHDSLCETYLHRTLRSKRVLKGAAQEFFAVTPTELAGIVQEAREFLDEFVLRQEDAERLAKEESDGSLLVPGDEEWSMYHKLLEVREEQDGFTYQREFLENKLKLAIGRTDGLEGIATWKTQARERFDEAAFKVAHPELFKSYVSVSRMRFFRLI